MNNIIPIILSSAGITGLVFIGFAALLRLMPDLPYPRIRDALSHFFPQGQSYQNARNNISGPNQSRTIHWERHPEVIDTLKPVLIEELDINAEDINKIEFLHQSLRIDARGNTRHISNGYDQPRKHLDQLIKQEQEDYYNSWSVIFLTIGIVCSIMGSLTIFF